MPPPPAPGGPPPTFEGRTAFARILGGLQRAGYPEEDASIAARAALLEAPFAAPDPTTWGRVCNRARQLANEGRPWGIYPRLDPATGLALPPRDR